MINKIKEIEKRAYSDNCEDFFSNAPEDVRYLLTEVKRLTTANHNLIEALECAVQERDAARNTVCEHYMKDGACIADACEWRSDTGSCERWH